MHQCYNAKLFGLPKKAVMYFYLATYYQVHLYTRSMIRAKNPGRAAETAKNKWIKTHKKFTRNSLFVSSLVKRVLSQHLIPQKRRWTESPVEARGIVAAQKPPLEKRPTNYGQWGPSRPQQERRHAHRANCAAHLLAMGSQAGSAVFLASRGLLCCSPNHRLIHPKIEVCDLARE